MSFVTCERCAHASLNKGGLQTSNCAHSILLKTIQWNHAADVFLDYTDAFETWITKQAKLPFNIISISRRGGSHVFLVVLDQDSVALQIHMRVALCYVLVRNENLQVRCTNPACIAQRKVAVANIPISKRRKTEFHCQHLKLLFQSKHYLEIDAQCHSRPISSDSESSPESIDDTDSNQDSGSECDLNHETIPDNEKPNHSVNGVFWDGENWQVIDSCSPSPIPLEETEACKEWRFRRLTGKDIVNLGDDKVCGSKQGSPCVAQDVCSSCGHGVDAKNAVIIGDMALHTRIGTIHRKRIALWCWRCSVQLQWDPALECIHTVANGKHGGLHYLYHLKLIDSDN